MGIYERKDRDKQLYGQVKDRNGAWIKKTLNTKDKHVAKIRYRELERTEADPTYRAANETTFSDAVTDFIASRRRKGCADATLSFYDVKTAHLLRVLGETTPMSRINSVAVDKYIDKRLQEGASRNTLGKELTALRGTLKIARRAKKLVESVDMIMPEEWSNDYEPRKRTLTSEELNGLLLALGAERLKKDRWKVVRANMGRERNGMNQAACVAFMVATGCRLGEAFRAQRSHIQLSKGLVFLVSTKTKRKARGDRYVPVTALTRQLLDHVLAATNGRTTLFDPWSNINRDIADACESIGILRCSPNDLRRTHGTWLRNAGVDPQLIGAALGHVDSRMVERVYGRLTPDHLKKLLNERVETIGRHT